MNNYKKKQISYASLLGISSELFQKSIKSSVKHLLVAVALVEADGEPLSASQLADILGLDKQQITREMLIALSCVGVKFEDRFIPNINNQLRKSKVAWIPKGLYQTLNVEQDDRNVKFIQYCCNQLLVKRRYATQTCVFLLAGTYSENINDSMRLYEFARRYLSDTVIITKAMQSLVKMKFIQVKTKPGYINRNWIIANEKLLAKTQKSLY